MSRIKRLVISLLFISLFYVGLCFTISLLPLINGFVPSFSLSFIHGESMLPFLKDGDLVVSSPFQRGIDELREGMIVRYRDVEDGRPIIIQHRIEETSGNGVITMGDNNDSVPDGLVAYGQIESIYRFKIPLHYMGMGLITSFLFNMGNYIREFTVEFPASLYAILLLLTSILYARMRSTG